MIMLHPLAAREVNIGVLLGPNEEALQIRKRLIPEPSPQVAKETAHQGFWVFLFRVVGGNPGGKDMHRNVHTFVVVGKSGQP
jgi:hypothetical protein